MNKVRFLKQALLFNLYKSIHSDKIASIIGVFPPIFSFDLRQKPLENFENESKWINIQCYSVNVHFECVNQFDLYMWTC